MDGLAATYAMLYSALSTSSIWGTRCYADYAPAESVRPYSVFYKVSGGALRDNRAGKAVHRYVMTVACATTNALESSNGAAWIYRLHNAGTGNPAGVARLVDIGGWRPVSCISTGDRIHVIERVGAENIFYDGYEFEITLLEV